MDSSVGNDDTIKRLIPNPEWMSNTNIAVIGNSKSGKSVLVRHILQFMRDVPLVSVICVGPKATSFYSRIIPRSQIFDGTKLGADELRKYIESRDAATEEFVENWDMVRDSLMAQAVRRLIPFRDSEVFEIITGKIVEQGTIRFCKSRKEIQLVKLVYQLMLRQEKRAGSSKIAEEIRRRRSVMFSDKRSMLIFDDMMGVPWFVDSRPSTRAAIDEVNPIYTLLARGRNAYITSFYILQSYTNSGLGSVARGAYHFIFIMGNLKTYDAIRKDTIDGMIRTKSRTYIKRFHNMVKGILSQKGGAIVLAQDKPSTGVFDSLYYYKVAAKHAKYPPPLKFRQSIAIPGLSEKAEEIDQSKTNGTQRGRGGNKR